MMSAFQVSVIIPAYNAEAIVERSLGSVDAQTLSPDEVIVVDDGSRDGTAARVESFRPRQIGSVRLIRQANAGPGAARNAGLRAAAAPYVAFLDAGDTWQSEKLARVAEAFMARPDAVVCCHDVAILGRGGRLVRHAHTHPVLPDLHEQLLLHRNVVVMSSVVTRRDVLLACGGFSEDREFDSNEDWDLWLRLTHAGWPFLLLPEVLGEWREAEMSLSSNVEQHFRTEMNVLMRHLEENGILGAQPWKARRRIAAAIYRKARGHHRNGAPRLAFAAYLTCLRTYPLYVKAYAGLALLAAGRTG